MPNVSERDRSEAGQTYCQLSCSFEILRIHESYHLATHFSSSAKWRMFGNCSCSRCQKPLETSQVFGSEAATPVGLQTKGAGRAGQERVGPLKGAGQALESGGPGSRKGRAEPRTRKRVGQPQKEAGWAPTRGWAGSGKGRDGPGNGADHDPEWGRPSSGKGFAFPEKGPARPGEEAGRAPDRGWPGPWKEKGREPKSGGPGQGGPGLRCRRLALRQRLALRRRPAATPCGDGLRALRRGINAERSSRGLCEPASDKSPR